MILSRNLCLSLIPSSEAVESYCTLVHVDKQNAVLGLQDQKRLSKLLAVETTAAAGTAAEGSL